MRGNGPPYKRLRGGGPGGNRTPDQGLRSPLLYPLSYGPAGLHSSKNHHGLGPNAWDGFPRAGIGPYGVKY